MRYLKIMLLVLPVLIWSCSDDDDLCLRGNGQLDRHELVVADFNQVSLIGPIDLNIVQGPNHEVIIDAEGGIYEHLTAEVSNQVLTVGFEDNISCFETNFGVLVNIQVPDLQGVSITGESQVTSTGNLELQQLSIDVSGAGEISLDGYTDDFYLTAAGSVQMNNFELETQNTYLDIAGSANIEVWCEALLDIKVSGSAIVSYIGNPVIEQDIAGELALIDAN